VHQFLVPTPEKNEDTRLSQLRRRAPCMPRACAIGARRTSRSAPTLAYTSPQSNTRTHTFASTNRGWEIFRPNLANPATTSVPFSFRVVVDDGLHVSSAAPRPSNFSPHPFRSPRSIDRAQAWTRTRPPPTPSCTLLLPSPRRERAPAYAHWQLGAPRASPAASSPASSRQVSRLATLRTTSGL